MDADVIVVGAGLAGLVATHELARRGKRVAVLDQEGPANLGGQAYWSLGGLFLVDSPEQRRLGVTDSVALAWHDWQGSAGFDRPEDEWGRRWARAYVEFAAGENRSWPAQYGISFLPTVGWAERGSLRADGHGNSVPRFHVAWGTGPGVLDPFVRAVRERAAAGLVTFQHRHVVDALVTSGGAVQGCAAGCRHPTPRRVVRRATGTRWASSN
ncbi:putative oxidoreductase [Embleya sp. AB8]